MGKKANTTRIHFNTRNENYTVREEQHQGRTFIVVPVTMMVEGVHNGSHGPLLHTIDDLGRFTEAWNGIPVTIDHPEIDGKNVSANSPQIIDTSTVGRVYNTFVEGNKLKAEAWIDKIRLGEVSPSALTKIQANEIIEISVGVFTEDEPEQGNWNGEDYTGIAKNHRPDHLALLPEGIGACSVDDGCGVRVHSDNHKKGGIENKMETVAQESAEKKEGKKLEIINQTEDEIQSLKDSKMNAILQANIEESFTEKVEKVRKKVDAMDNELAVHYLLEVYGDFVVFETRVRNTNETKMYKYTYQIDANGDIEFVGNRQLVRRKVSYELIPMMQKSNKVNNNKKEGTMEKDSNQNPPCGQCMEKVVAIINSNKTQFTAADREWLLTQEEAVLDKLLPVEEKSVTDPQNNSKGEVKITNEQVLQALSADDRAALAFGKKQLAERKATMVKGIQDNAGKETWPDEVLGTMADDMLERLYKSVAKPEQQNNQLVDFSAMASFQRSIVDNVGEIEPLLPTGIEFETKK